MKVYTFSQIYMKSGLAIHNKGVEWEVCALEYILLIYLEKE